MKAIYFFICNTVIKQISRITTISMKNRLLFKCHGISTLTVHADPTNDVGSPMKREQKYPNVIDDRIYWWLSNLFISIVISISSITSVSHIIFTLYYMLVNLHEHKIKFLSLWACRWTCARPNVYYIIQSVSCICDADTPKRPVGCGPPTHDIGCSTENNL